MEQVDERVVDLVGAVTVAQRREPHVAAGPVEHGRDRGPVERPDDQIALKVTDLAAGLVGGGPDAIPITRRLGRAVVGSLSTTWRRARDTCR
jgi:hypothetical protein